MKTILKQIAFGALIFIFTLSGILCFSQDTLVKKDNSIIEVKVIEIGTDVIKYKKSNYLDGPTYTIAKSDVNKVIFKTGEEEIFEDEVVYANSEVISVDKLIAEKIDRAVTYKRIDSNLGIKFILIEEKKNHYELIIDITDDRKIILENDPNEIMILFEGNKSIRQMIKSNRDKIIILNFDLYDKSLFQSYKRIEAGDLTAIIIKSPEKENKIVIDKKLATDLSEMFSELYKEELYEDF